MIQCVLWDIDGTLLDFLQSEAHGIRTCFSLFNLGTCTDEMLARYSAINRSWWEKLERGEHTKQEILEGRFREFFESEGLPTDCVAEFNTSYQIHLGDRAFFFEGARETVSTLKKRGIAQYAVTNGTAIAQDRKLKLSELDQLLDGIFISERVGFEKPDPRFFDVVFSKIPFERAETVIIGDSLTGDMQGGINAGLTHWWFNPSGKPADRPIDRTISHLTEVLEWLK